MRWNSPTWTSGLQKALGWSRPKAQGPDLGLNSFVFACWTWFWTHCQMSITPWFLVRKMVGVSIPAETHWYCWLVVTGTMEFYDFPDIGNVIIPTDIHIFQRGRYTTNQYGIFATCRSMFGVPPFWISKLDAGWQLDWELWLLDCYDYCARNTLGKALTHIHFIIINHFISFHFTIIDT